MIGRTVGNFRIVEKIGEGGMGAVYRAVDLMLERDVAIKAIRPELSREPEIAERFRAEARTLARVAHPAIATIYSFFYEGEDLFLAMELVRGRSLTRVLETDGPIAWQRAIHLLASALDGIGQAHRAGIVHRDIKPDNLMLTEADTLKVMDFGIARVMGSGHLTRTGLLVGTLRYMSPEQIKGEEVDGRADIYALGAVLYEMLTGRPAFQGGNDWALLKAQIEDPPRPPGEHVPQIPWWLDRVVLKALAKQPAERFQTVEEMRLTLLRQGDTMISSRPAPVPPSGSIEDLPTRVTPPGSRVTPLPAPTPAGPSPIPAVTLPGPAPSSYRPVELPQPGTPAWKNAAAFAVPFLVILTLAVGGFLVWRGRGQQPQDEIIQALTPSSGEVKTAAAVPPGPQPAATPATELPAAQEPVERPTPPRPEPTRQEPPRTSAPPSQVVAPVEDESPAQSSAPERAPEPAPPEPAAPEPEAPAAPLQEMQRLAGELQAQSNHLLEVYQAHLEQKEEAGGEITDKDEQLEEDIEALIEVAEKFGNSFKQGFIGRLRKRNPEDRTRIRERFNNLALRGGRVEALIAETQPSAEVRQAWQEVRRRWRRVGEILSGM